VSRIYLSAPDVGEREREMLLAAFDSGWIAPLGPSVDEFEHAFAAFLGVDDALALSSGTAGLHLALVLLDVQPGDDVIVPTLTFVATANVVRYLGAQPCFLDADEASWNLAPALLEEELAARADQGRLPAAVIGVDLYGQCADWARITEVCARYEVPTVDDAAEALGATCCGQPAGTHADVSTFSFNGNKIATTSGGGMLTARRPELVAHARKLATHAREPTVHYEHTELGYNYRLSNLLGALGVAQLERLPEMLARRRAINRLYREALGDLPGVKFMPVAPYGEPTHWLTVVTIDEVAFGATRDEIVRVLDAEDIEARPTWKPMHLQPLYADAPTRGGAVAARIFETGLCLPSGSVLSDADVARAIDAFKAVSVRHAHA